jgi:hypothetical protein
MSFLPQLGGLLGMNGGANGTGFSAPTAAPITPGTDPNQIATAYGGAQNSLTSQQALLSALQGQNGLQNQNQVYGQLQGIANGTGPNPAQTMLNQATGQNVANQAALMAGQRGAGANVGLMARQAAQQGAATQQQAVGQGATMQAQQSLNALQNAGQMANTQAGQLISGTNANTQAQQSEQQLLQNALASNNQQNVAMQSNLNNTNAQLAGNTMDSQNDLMSNGLSSLPSALGSLGKLIFAAQGGNVPGIPSIPYADFFKDWKGMCTGGRAYSSYKTGGSVSGKAKVSGNSYSNDTVKAMLSPGELVVDRNTMQDKGPAGQMARTLAALIAAKNRGGK